MNIIIIITNGFDIKSLNNCSSHQEIFRSRFGNFKFKKKREINLYSPEYLDKKHGINLNDVKTSDTKKSNENVSFGFYNSLILFLQNLQIQQL